MSKGTQEHKTEQRNLTNIKDHTSLSQMPSRIRGVQVRSWTGRVHTAHSSRADLRMKLKEEKELRVAKFLFGVEMFPAL